MALRRRGVTIARLRPTRRSALRVSTGSVGKPRSGATLALSLLLATGAIAAGVQPALAYSCIPGRSAAGGTYSADVALNLGGTTVNGVSASILEYSPYTTDATGTTVSVMLTQDPAYSGWAQLGWFKTKIQEPDGRIGSMHRSVGIEFHPQTGSPSWQFWTAEPVGNMTWYEINYDTSGHVFHFFVGGTLVWDQNSSMPTNVYELINETHQRQDQFPGNIFNPVVSNQVNYFTPPGYTAHVSTARIIPNTNAAPFAGIWPSGAANGKYEVWDTACT